MPAPRPPRSRPTPLSQGIAVVRLMVHAGHSLGVTRLACELGMPKSSVHRVLQTLCELGFVQRADATRRYMLSADIFDFVHEIAWHFGRNLKLDRHLRAAAAKLGCSVYLSMLGKRHTYVICAAGHEGSTTRLGSHGPAYASSAGKAIISQLPEGEWPRYAPGPDDPPGTPYTNRDPRKFLARLREARDSGVAWNVRETDKDIVSLATVVREPFVAQPRLAVALVLRHEERLHRDDAELVREIKRLAETLEKQLGRR